MCNFVIWSAFPVVVVFEAIFVRLVNNSKMSEENFLVNILIVHKQIRRVLKTLKAMTGSPKMVLISQTRNKQKFHVGIEITQNYHIANSLSRFSTNSPPFLNTGL